MIKQIQNYFRQKLMICDHLYSLASFNSAKGDKIILILECVHCPITKVFNIDPGVVAKEDRIDNKITA
jgi:hypothetical protein